MQYIREIIFLLDDDRLKIPWMVLLFIFTSMFDLAGIGLVGPYVNAVVNPETFLDSNIGNTLIMLGFPTEIKDILFILGMALIGVFFLKAIMSIIINWVIQRFIVIRDIKMRSYLMHSYQELPYSEYINRNSSEYIHTINNRVACYSGGVLQPGMKILSDGIIGIAILFFLGWTNSFALALLFILLSVTSIIYIKFSRKKIKQYGERSDSSNLQMVQAIQEGIDGLKEIRILGVTPYFYNKVSVSATDAGYNGLKANLITTMPRYLIEFMLIFAIVLMVLFSIGTGQSVSTIAPTLGVFGVASLRLVPLANLIVTGISQLRYHRAAIANLYQDLKDLNHQKFSKSTGLTEKVGLEPFNKLELQGLSFLYSNSNENSWVLQNISLTINNGDSIGFIGSSGAGKTTLIDTLLGLLDPQEGEIYFNNQSLKKSLPSWRAQVAYLPQEIFLIDNTLQSNVALGVSEGDIERGKVIDALNQAKLTELVAKLPKGIDTMIGERGVRLSGGQKQRVALARAFYHGRNVLVLDEATSSLDNETEQEIIEEIRHLKGKKTILVVAHRLTTVQHCERIYRLEQGRIVETGTFEHVIGSKNKA